MAVPGTIDRLRGSQRSALPGWEHGCVFSYLLALRGTLHAAAGKDCRQTYAREYSEGGAGNPGHLYPGWQVAALWSHKSVPLPFSDTSQNPVLFYSYLAAYINDL